MHVISRGAGLAGAALFLASGLSAQYAHRHQGIFASFGAGFGTAKVSCDNCGDVSRAGDLTGFLEIGGALSRSILLGVEVAGWSKVTSGNDNRAAGTVNGVAVWYPSTEEGFFLKGGAGFGYLHGDQALSDGRIIFLDKGGVGYQLGLGYDLRIQRDLSVTALVNFYGGNVGDIGALRSVKFNVLQFMAAVTFH